MNRLKLLGAATAALLFPLIGCAGTPAAVEVYDRTMGRTLPVYWHDGRRFIAGEPGHEYEIRISNRSGGRVLAVTSVDGVNVVDGRAAAPDQAGYVIDPRGSVAIDGWRKSLDAVASFYFTSLPDSYAARTGRPANVGVIGVALFHEQERPCCEQEIARPQSAPPAASGDRSASAEATARESGKLGTGHGAWRDSGARLTSFERATREPASVVTIYYDSRRHLVAQGVLPSPRYATRSPEPFPGGFVPDP